MEWPNDQEVDTLGLKRGISHVSPQWGLRTLVLIWTNDSIDENLHKQVRTLALYNSLKSTL